MFSNYKTFINAKVGEVNFNIPHHTIYYCIMPKILTHTNIQGFDFLLSYVTLVLSSIFQNKVKVK